MLRSLTPQRRRLLVGTIITVALLVFVLVWQIVRAEGPRANRVPVLLVHGYGGTGESMSALERALEDRGRTVVLVELPDNGTAAMEVSARALADAVAATGAQRVDLVGFSAGGIVVRTYLIDFDGSSVARQVVLLGSPNHGAEAAGFAASVDPTTCVDACADLTPGSSFLDELNRGDETPDGPDYTSIWTANDDTVTPPESAVLDGAANIRVQDVCADSTLGHGDLVTAPLGVGLVLQALTGRQPDGTCEALRELGAAALRT
jgi:triacylglycerol lipase